MNRLLSVFLLSLTHTSVHAQILWQPVENITGKTTDFSLLGTFVDAADVNGGTMTVTSNGETGGTAVGTETFTAVSFSSSGATDGSDISFAGVNDGAGGDSYVPSGTSPDSSQLQGDYGQILSGVIYDGNGAANDGTVTLSGLTPGDVYQVELWKGAGYQARDTVYTSGSDVATLLSSDYVIGTFTAPAATSGDTSSFTFGFAADTADGGYAGEINAISLRDVTVPEPSTYAMMLGGLGLLAFVGFRARRA